MRRFGFVVLVLMAVLAADAVGQAPMHRGKDGILHTGESPEKCVGDRGRPGPCITGARYDKYLGQYVEPAAPLAGGAEIKSPDGRPIFYIERVENFLFDAPLYWFYEGYYDAVPQFPASSDRRMNASEQVLNPEFLKEGFALAFQGVGHVRREQEPDRGYDPDLVYGRLYYSQKKIVDYPIPASANPDVWFVSISGKVTESWDGYSAGATVKRAIISLAAEIGGRLLLQYVPGPKGVIPAVAALTLADALRYQEYNFEALKMFEVTAEFKNAATGDIFTVEGAPRDSNGKKLFAPVVVGNFVFFYGVERGRMRKMSLKDAIGDAFRDLLPQAVKGINTLSQQHQLLTRKDEILRLISELAAKKARGGTLTEVEERILEEYRGLRIQSEDSLYSDALDWIRSQRRPQAEAPPK